MKHEEILVVKSGIDYAMLNEVKQQVSSTQTSDDSEGTLYILFETSGGLPMAAVKTMEILNCRYKKLYAIVFNVAMSAGTLMCLGCDKIFMDDGACLGPLDLQIPHPNDDSHISTLDVRDTMISLMSQASIIAQQFADDNIKSGVSKTTAIKMGYDSAIELLLPIADKIDPYHYRESFRNSEMGAVYGTNLLKRRMMKNNPQLAEAVGLHLANRYMAHNYMIFQKEAKDRLHLLVEHINKLPPHVLEAAREAWADCGDVFSHSGDVIRRISITNKTKEEQKKDNNTENT